MNFLKQNKLIIIALAISALVIGSTYAFLRYSKKAQDSESVDTTALLSTIPGIQADDHVLGNPRAPILFFVYSDFSCPYCADYHMVLRKIMQVFGSEGKIAVVFRHFPLVELHPEAPLYALTSECIAQETGNAGFWAFADYVFKNHNPDKPLELAKLVSIAEKLGASKQTFVSCMRSNELMSHVEKEFAEGKAGGAEGSPFTVIETLGERALYQGFQSYQTVAITVQTLLRKVEATPHGESTTNLETELKSISEELDKIDQQTSTTASSSTTHASTTTAATSSSTTQNKEPSILDDIL